MRSACERPFSAARLRPSSPSRLSPGCPISTPGFDLTARRLRRYNLPLLQGFAPLHFCLTLTSHRAGLLLEARGSTCKPACGQRRQTPELIHLAREIDPREEASAAAPRQHSALVWTMDELIRSLEAQ